MLDKIISAILNFMLAFIVLTICWAVSETLGYFKPQPMALRQLLAMGMALASLAFAVWRWRRTPVKQQVATKQPSARAAAPQPDRLAERMKAMTAVSKPVVGARIPADAAAPAGDAAALIAAAGRQAIVMRQIFPPMDGVDRLSFFGGAPVAPADFAWPVSASGAPLSFIMQVDCAAVPARGRLDALPPAGVLYFFINLDWGNENIDWGNDGHKVLYAERGQAEWRQAAVPAALKPPFGSEAKYLWPWAQSEDDMPRLLPKWPFDPVVIDVPVDEGVEGDDGEGAPSWNDHGGMAERLLDAQGEGAAERWLDVRDFLDEDRALRRPYAAYPHDHRAMQTAAAAMRERAERAHRYDDFKHQLPGLDKDGRDTLMATIVAETEHWLDYASHGAPFDAVEDEARELFWAWLAGHAAVACTVLPDAVTTSIEWSLTASPEAAARVPADVAERVRHRHMLAAKPGADIWATTPDRMLAAHSDVQGNNYERAQTHLLLLELSSNNGLLHHFGEGVYQFWITPDDLRARRFDRVVLTTDAY